MTEGIWDATLGFVLLAGLYVLVQYNGLVALRNHIRESWSDVDTELRRRHDLIPNLVATVHGYAVHEREVLERVTELRRLAHGGGDAKARSPDEERLARALDEVFVVAERYPALRADRTFLRLQDELALTEDRIQAARRFFNGNVRDYRNRRETFPSSLVAAAFGFPPEEYFTMDSVFRRPPGVAPRS